MTDFKLIFTGRVKGEEGKLARIAASRRAENKDMAILRLFEAYTDIRIISVEELPDAELIRAGHGHAAGGSELRPLGRA